MDGAGNQAWCRAQLRAGECEQCEDMTADSPHFGHLASPLQQLCHPGCLLSDVWTDVPRDTCHVAGVTAACPGCDEVVCSHYLLLVNVATAAASSQEAIRGAGGGGAAGRWTWGQSAAASSLCKDNPVPSPHIIDRPRCCCGVGAGVGAHDQVMMKPKLGYGLGLGHGTLHAEEVSQSVCSRRGQECSSSIKR